MKISTVNIENPRPDIKPAAGFVVSAIVMCVLVLLMFGDVLFTTKDIVLSSPRGDVSLQFLPWRQFGFGELRKGNFPLWNPYIFSGMPYFSEPQSALLYPLNLIYAFTPVARAINISIAIHVFLLGIFMYLWTAGRGLHWLACFVSSVLMMFSSTYFLHIYAGHLPNLCAMVWVPLIFLAIDKFFERQSLGWCILGMFAVTMQVLAGHPQYVFYTVIAAGIYSLLRLISTTGRLLIIAGLAVMYGGALALSVVQIWSSYEAASESVRSGGTAYEFAAMLSFPPENFLTLLIPGLFGNGKTFLYWGRWYLWEMSLFISVTGLWLAVCGLRSEDKFTRRILAAMVVALSILALGAYTPLFKLLYEAVPGFAIFRGNSKFIFFVSLFLVLLSAYGIDKIIRCPVVSSWIVILAAITGIILIAGGMYIRAQPMMWGKIMLMVFHTGQSYLPAACYSDSSFIQQAAELSARGVLIAGGLSLLTAALLYIRRYSPHIPKILAALAVLEILIFAKGNLCWFEADSIMPAGMKEFAAKDIGDCRVLYPYNANIGMLMGLQNIWGYDPGVLRRYAEFIAFTQGINPDKASQYIQFTHLRPLLKLLRCGYVLINSANANKIEKIISIRATVPRLMLVSNWIIIPERDRIFARMGQVDFDPFKTVVLESEPNLTAAETVEVGRTQIVDYSTDHLTIEASLPAPAILVITDAYSPGWRAIALAGSEQKKYSVMPADYVCRAIPLSKGFHRIRVEYLPSAFAKGRLISLIAAVLYAGLIVWYLKGKFGRRKLLESPKN